MQSTTTDAGILMFDNEDVINAVRLALGRQNVPMLLSEKDVEKIGLRTAVSLRRDRCRGTSYLPYIKDPAGRIRYRLSDIVAVMSGSLNIPSNVSE